MGIQGIIRPPPEIRAVADKTASFVAKNGRGFEARIMNSAKGKTPKFAFLHDSSPFHAYYEDRIIFYTNGGTDKKEEEEKKKVDVKDSDDSGAVQLNEGDKVKAKSNTVEEKKDSKDVALLKESSLTARKANSIVDPVARTLLAQRSKIQSFMNQADSIKKEKDDADAGAKAEAVVEQLAPPVQTYTTIVPPQNISNAQLDIIKLTAQFVVLNGKGGSFLRELTVREWENPMWGFLQPRHGYFAYFSQMVDLYRGLLQGAVVIHEQNVGEKKKQQKGKVDEISEEGKGDRISNTSNEQRYGSLIELSELKRKAGIDSVAEEKGNIRQQIKLVTDTAGNVPKCLEHAALHSEFDRYYEEKRNEELESMQANGGIGGSARIDWHDFVVVETIEFAVDEVVEMLPPPPPPVPKKVEEVFTRESKSAEEIAAEAMDESSDEEDGDGEEIKVVDDYAPKVVSSQAKFSSQERTHVIDPITGKSIPIADMTEHMRIQLLDPKWAEEKAKFLEKQSESNLVGGDAIARNMQTFAKARTDLFGSSQGVEKDEKVRARLEASRIAHAQPQMPQPRPAQPQIPPPPMSGHTRPDMAIPDAKRARIDNAPPPVPAPVPVPVPIPPPPVNSAAPLPPAVMPPTSTTTMPGAPPPPAPPPPPRPEADTEIITTTLSEADFAQSLSDPNFTIQIQIPNDPTYASWNFDGRIISIEAVNVMTKVKALKQQIRHELGDMPLNKMQLKSPSIGFLKDSSSLSYLNIGPDHNFLELLPKLRGGRKY